MANLKKNPHSYHCFYHHLALLPLLTTTTTSTVVLLVPRSILHLLPCTSVLCAYSLHWCHLYDRLWCSCQALGIDYLVSMRVRVVQKRNISGQTPSKYTHAHHLTQIYIVHNSIYIIFFFKFARSRFPTQTIRFLHCAVWRWRQQWRSFSKR